MRSSNSASTQEAGSSSLRIIRIALVGGVVMMGGALWFIVQQSGAPTLSSDVLSWVRWGVLAVFAAAAVTLFVVRKKWTAADTLRRKRTLTLAGWALAEGMAIVGAIYLFLTMDPAFFIVGFLVQLVVSFVVLPVPTSDK